ncbi:MAG: hypothetical protein KDJ19_10555 [Hyphomicrobiaceae bacterium]|nr:hypothetical protein [Rhizobiaceae bacterium]MCB1518039.1 hypothetical protein [Hyphomicrobiaceae bacterium]MCC0023026.1 hypothetical protein [Hyphomicrobiaceae bacterium]
MTAPTEPEMLSKEDSDKLAKSRRGRSIALALVLGALAIVFYALTIVKMGPGVFNRPL